MFHLTAGRQLVVVLDLVDHLQPEHRIEVGILVEERVLGQRERDRHALESFHVSARVTSFDEARRLFSSSSMWSFERARMNSTTSPARTTSPMTVTPTMVDLPL